MGHACITALRIFAAKCDAAGSLSEAARPIASFTALVSEDARAPFIDGIVSFGTFRGFETATRPTRPDGKHVLVQMWRADLELTALNPFDDPKEFRINLYQAGGQQVAPILVHNFIEDLAATIGAIQGVTVR
jgi:hypothetical protein